MSRLPIFLLLTISLLPTYLSGCGKSSAESASQKSLPKESLSRLNATVKNASDYSHKKTLRLDSLKSELPNVSEDSRLKLLVDLSAQYRQFNTDSAIRYARLAAVNIPESAPELMRVKAKLAVANAYSTSGLFFPAIQIIDSIRGNIHSMESKIEFWKARRLLYSYMLAFVRNRGDYADLFRRNYMACDDSLLSHLPNTDPFYLFLHSERLVSNRKWDEAERALQSILDSNPIESNIYGMAAFQLAEVYKNRGNFPKFVEYVALSSESDIKGCVREGVALPTLANWLYSQGDFEDAFNFINFALEEANSGNIRMRIATIMPMMPIIDRTYRETIDSAKDMMMGFLIVTLSLLLIMAILTAWLVKTLHHNKNNERRLAESSHTLEAYVANFIGLCSNYATRLEQLAKLVKRKLAAGQADELQKLVGSGRFTEEDNEEFYRLIDKAVLDIFPDFVDSINTLLAPDKRISLKQDENLTPELRIYAFIRLGVDQGAKIAQILQYSVNTVYSYRNRMRNRAINRETFDEDVKNLGRNKDYFTNFIE